MAPFLILFNEAKLWYLFMYVCVSEVCDGWFGGFYGISTFVGYLRPNPFYVNNLFYLKQFSLA